MKLEEDYYRYLAAGELHVQHCNACNKDIMYPRLRCRFCYSKDLGWRRATGQGTLLSFTVLRAAAPSTFRDDVPYGLGVVRLDEGPQLLVRLQKDDSGEFGNYRCDMPVEFAPVSAEEIARRPVAWFRARA